MARVPPTPNYKRRMADETLAELVSEMPAVLINGPRAVGKTTTARQLANEEVRLDRPGTATAFRADPDAQLKDRDEPLLIDEWQEVPEVLGAVKRSVDLEPRPGRFILTGSVRADLEHSVWPGTGRLARLSMFGLTEREKSGEPGLGFLERLATADEATFHRPPNPPDITDYVNLAVRGGFPDVSLRGLTANGAARWMRSYLDQLLTRDVAGANPADIYQKMRSYFEALSLSNAGVPAAKTLYDAAGINAKTAAKYDKLLNDLFIAEQVPAWQSNRLSRLTKTPKRYIVDPGLAIAGAGLDAATILGDGDLLGRTMDSLVLSQLRPEVALEPFGVRLHHLREESGRQEVDIVAEMPGGRVVGLEVKAGSNPTGSDGKHLRWLRDKLGARFVSGAVLHTGTEVFQLDDRVLALPIATIWT